MRLLIVDYSGHPFQVQLSRELARRGHAVLHLFSAGFQTPRGNLTRQPGDPAGFAITGVTTRKPFAKASFVRRRAQEIEIGHAMAREIAAFRPDVVVSSNAPLDTQRIIQRAAKGARFVFWLQDVYSRGIASVVPRRFPVIGHAVAYWYTRLEFAMLRRSDAVVAITADFRPVLAGAGVAPERVVVVENWAPLDELTPLPRDNEWARANMAEGEVRFVYSGTLGYKHNPDLLLRIAERLPRAHMYVFSEGEVANDLARRAAAAGVGNLSVRPWVPFADLPAMLSGADVFVSVIEPEAGVFSVPSKVLTYLAIGRAILASVPPVNLAAKTIVANGAGLVADPADPDAALAAAARLADDPAEREAMGRRGRAYAERTFDVTRIADRFEAEILAPNHLEKAA